YTCRGIDVPLEYSRVDRDAGRGRSPSGRRHGQDDQRRRYHTAQSCCVHCDLAGSAFTYSPLISSKASSVRSTTREDEERARAPRESSLSTGTLPAARDGVTLSIV